MATKARAKATKKTTRKRAATKKTAAKKTARKASPARKATKSSAKRKTITPEALARKIVKAASAAPAEFPLEELYAEDCRSFEPGQAEPAVGHEGLRQKLAGFEEMVADVEFEWNTRNVFIKRNVICIEWEVQIRTEDGAKHPFNEVAVHEIKGGKIVEERYYYDAAAFAAIMGAQDPEPQTEPELDPPPSTAFLEEASGPQPDPIDL